MGNCNVPALASYYLPRLVVDTLVTNFINYQLNKRTYAYKFFQITTYVYFFPRGEKGLFHKMISIYIYIYVFFFCVYSRDRNN